MEIKSKILVRFCPIKYFSLRKCSCKYEVTKFSQSETNRYYFSRIDFYNIDIFKIQNLFDERVLFEVVPFYNFSSNKVKPKYTSKSRQTRTCNEK